MAQASVLSIAKSQIGVKESPANSNNVKYNTWFYGHAVSGPEYPWCAVFIAWCFKQAGILSNIAGVKNKAYCPSYVLWAKSKGRWHSVAKTGALVLYDWNKDGIADHVGIVESIKDRNTIVAIEGNTAIGNESNGGQVMRRTRSTAYVLGYIYVTIYGKPTADSKGKQEKQRIEVDGSIGPATVKEAQGWLRTTQDGVISSQPESNRAFLPAVSAIEYVKKATGSDFVRALQKCLNKYETAGIPVDGILNKRTVSVLQAFLNKRQTVYKLQRTGFLDETTAKAFQTYLNSRGVA